MAISRFDAMADDQQAIGRFDAMINDQQEGSDKGLIKLIVTQFLQATV